MSTLKLLKEIRESGDKTPYSTLLRKARNFKNGEEIFPEKAHPATPKYTIGEKYLKPIKEFESESTNMPIKTSPLDIDRTKNKTTPQQSLNPISKDEYDRRSEEMINYKKNYNSYDIGDVPMDMLRIIKNPINYIRDPRSISISRLAFKKELYKPGNQKNINKILLNETLDNSIGALQTIGTGEFAALAPGIINNAARKTLYKTGSKANLLSNILGVYKDVKDVDADNPINFKELSLNILGAASKTRNIDTGNVITDLVAGTTNFRSPFYIFDAVKDATSHGLNFYDLKNKK